MIRLARISDCTEDQAVIETARRDGIAVLKDLLDEDELTSVRDEFDRLHLELGKGPGQPGVRDGVSGDALLKYPHVAALFSHPRIIAVVAAMLDEDQPWAWQLKTNRYTPEHKGVSKHTDGVLGELAPPYTRQSMAVFLDDIDADSGAFTYVPGSHELHFESATDQGRRPPTQDDIDAGDYVPATLRAGSVVMRVPEVWHAVIPHPPAVSICNSQLHDPRYPERGHVRARPGRTRASSSWLAGSRATTSAPLLRARLLIKGYVRVTKII